MERRSRKDADDHMTEYARAVLQEATSETPESSVIDVQGFARLTHIAKATILTLRSRAPDQLPPPFRQHPLRWRTQTVVRWMEKLEQRELERIARHYRRV